MQEFTNGQEVEVRTVKAGPSGLDSWERMEYIGPWSDRHACHRIDYRGEHPTFYADDDGIRPVRRTVREIAEHYGSVYNCCPAAVERGIRAFASAHGIDHE